MKRLAPDLFTRRFDDLVKLGRARLPGLAPAWTDHNLHDPGITLMELLAWVAEAQMYSLSRVRTDERAAYAALMGAVPAGTRPATGLLWPDPADPDSPAATYRQAVVVGEDASVHVRGAPTPAFHPRHRLVWIPGRVAGVRTRLADGRVLDHTAANVHGGAAFLPFGEEAGARDVLSIDFETRDDAGILAAGREARGAFWTIGVRADAPRAGSAAPADADDPGVPSPLQATLVDERGRHRLPIFSDTTAGFLATGALSLDLSALPHSPRRFTLELRAPGGFERAPRVLRIEPNVVPIVQGRAIVREEHVPDGRPDWGFDLETPGLRFAPGAAPVLVEVDEPSGLQPWHRCERLPEEGPGARVYELDPVRARLTFGNGLNGRLPSRGERVYVSYAVCDAASGAVPRNRKWRVAGFEGAFGVNPDAVAGGAAASSALDLRREARRRAREDHALVSAADIVEAARALPALEVARAWPMPPSPRAPRTGEVILVAMRARGSGPEPADAPETRRWLEAIRRKLAPRMPLGSRLVVTAPGYADFGIRAILEAYEGRDPAVVREDVEKALARRLAIFSPDPRDELRAPGAPVTRRDVAAWIRTVEGVHRIVELRLLRPGAVRPAEDIAPPRGGLPRYVPTPGGIDVRRARRERRP